MPVSSSGNGLSVCTNLTFKYARKSGTSRAVLSGQVEALCSRSFCDSQCECGCLREVQYPQGFQEVDSSVPWSSFLLPSVTGDEALREAWAAVLV